MKKFLYLCAGYCVLGIGIAGIFVPLLPTTPFLILAAVCFLKSSPKKHAWLVNHKIFGFYIKSYLQFRAIPKKAKISALVFLWITITISAVFIVHIFWMKVAVGLIAVGVSVHLVRFKTLTKEMAATLKQKV